MFSRKFCEISKNSFSYRTPVMTVCGLMYVQFMPLHKKWSFPLRISSVNVTKSAGNCRFGHIYWKNLNGKFNFLCRRNSWFNVPNNQISTFILFENALVLFKVPFPSHKKCENTGFHWPIFSRIWTESVLIRENAGQWKPVFSHILCSAEYP